MSSCQSVSNRSTAKHIHNMCMCLFCTQSEMCTVEGKGNLRQAQVHEKRAHKGVMEARMLKRLGCIHCSTRLWHAPPQCDPSENMTNTSLQDLPDSTVTESVCVNMSCLRDKDALGMDLKRAHSEEIISENHHCTNSTPIQLVNWITKLYQMIF